MLRARSRSALGHPQLPPPSSSFVPISSEGLRGKRCARNHSEPYQLTVLSLPEKRAHTDCGYCGKRQNHAAHQSKLLPCLDAHRACAKPTFYRRSKPKQRQRCRRQQQNLGNASSRQDANGCTRHQGDQQHSPCPMLPRNDKCAPTFSLRDSELGRALSCTRTKSRTAFDL